jgi:GNAT superfamily N-acetyltransferase
MTPNSKWLLRAPKSSDLNFIYSTWLNNYRSDSEIGKSIKKSIYFAEYYGVLDAIFECKQTKVLIACLPEETNVILGFLVGADKILHYIFVKEDFRRNGIGRSLFENCFPEGGGAVEFTHRTTSTHRLAEKLSLTYNPFLLFERIIQGAQNGTIQ